MKKKMNRNNAPHVFPVFCITILLFIFHTVCYGVPYSSLECRKKLIQGGDTLSYNQSFEIMSLDERFYYSMLLSCKYKWPNDYSIVTSLMMKIYDLYDYNMDYRTKNIIKRFSEEGIKQGGRYSATRLFAYYSSQEIDSVKAMEAYIYRLKLFNVSEPRYAQEIANFSFNWDNEKAIFARLAKKHISQKDSVTIPLDNESFDQIPLYYCRQSIIVTEFDFKC